MNVSENSIKILYQLIEQCFIENRYFDRYVTVLGVKFAMNNTSELCHKRISHMFPILADKIGELCLERYNIPVEYGATPQAKEDYSSPQEIIKLMQDRIINFQDMLMGAVKITFENNDIHVYADLMELLQTYNDVVEQAILLVDKCELYGNNMASYDAHIETHFWNLEEGLYA